MCLVLRTEKTLPSTRSLTWHEKCFLGIKYHARLSFEFRHSISVKNDFWVFDEKSIDIFVDSFLAGETVFLASLALTRHPKLA